MGFFGNKASTLLDSIVENFTTKSELNDVTEDLTTKLEEVKTVKMPFKVWLGEGLTDENGVATISIPTDTFQRIDYIFPTAELNTSKAEEVPQDTLKTYDLSSIQINVTKYKLLSGLLGLLPTGEFVGKGVKITAFVIGV